MLFGNINNTMLFSLISVFYMIFFAIGFFVKKKVKSTELNIFKGLIIANLTSLIVEILLVVLIILDSSLLNIMLKVFNICIFSYVWIFGLYSYFISKRRKTINSKSWLFGLYLAYFIICSIGMLILPVHLNFENFKQYSYGPSVEFLFGAIGIIVTITIFMLLINFKHIKKVKCTPIIMFILFIALNAVLQYMWPHILLANSFFSFITFMMYFTIENPDAKMVNELEYAKNTAEKANRAKSDFLSSMSHEIRTPLNAIVGLSECIKNSDDIEEIHEDANDVVMASNNLLEIVNGILDISKIEADKMGIIETNYNPVELFEEVATIAKTRIGEKDIDLRCNFAEDIPDTLYGDKGKLKQIITNVLSNAVKYTEKGHIDFNVTCINEKEKCKLQIMISDTGRGIKKDQIDKIFNKFERSEEDMNSTIEGTGLGLAITKSLVGMMGGKILVDSTYGEGSKFTVLLEQKYSKEEKNTKEVKEDKVIYSNKKALIVDDNKLNIKVASKILREFGLNIDSADGGFECINKIENKEKYDIIFMDIMMPKMSGVEALKKLKQIENFNTPVVALTADAMEGKSTKYIEVGFNDYLSKPINKDELKRVLNKCLNENIEIEEEKTPEEDPHIHRVIPITDEDIEMLNRKLAEDLAKQQEQEEKEKNNN